jgi:hypothetical protein
MATTMTLAQLMTAVRQRADMAPSGYSPSLSATSYFVTDPELISYINQSAFELYDILIQKFGDDYFVADPYAISIVAGTDKYALPSDFYKLLGVDAALSGGTYIALKPFNFSERNRFSALRPTTVGVQTLRYRLNGNKVWFTPMPTAGMSAQLWYVPRFTPLALLTDTLEGVSGWTEYVIVDAAIKCLQKEESDVQVLLLQKAALEKRIESAAENRDAGSPATVADTQAMDYDGFDMDGSSWEGA